ncbi:MAG: hypothetical protein IID15_01830 [Candidatus Marinimicrobia bacterium]|nr:hypothetical protein [Candidatus Neomarinimicrobiota bacterium]
MEFSLTDFIIGLTLMNAMPHFVLGTFHARMLSGFGYGNRANILYGLFNFTISVVLYISSYSLSGLLSSGLYLGAVAVLLIYFVTGKYVYNRFKAE